MSLYCVFIAGIPAVTLPAAIMSSSGLNCLITFSKMICFKLPHLNLSIYNIQYNINTALIHLSFRLNIKPRSSFSSVDHNQSQNMKCRNFVAKLVTEYKQWTFMTFIDITHNPILSLSLPLPLSSLYLSLQEILFQPLLIPAPVLPSLSTTATSSTPDTQAMRQVGLRPVLAPGFLDLAEQPEQLPPTLGTSPKLQLM